jgi:mono/diheme cytochrome c family protein
MKQYGTSFAVTIALTCSIVCVRAHAADEVQQARVEMGRIWYQKYCTPCHGVGGAPGSAVFPATKQPVDLRTYVQRNGGKFPSGKWLNVVFGPQQGGIHTEVWEKIRSAQADSPERDAVARGVVANIAEYVMSVQKK